MHDAAFATLQETLCLISELGARHETQCERMIHVSVRLPSNAQAFSKRTISFEEVKRCHLPVGNCLMKWTTGAIGSFLQANYRLAAKAWGNKKDLECIEVFLSDSVRL